MSQAEAVVQDLLAQQHRPSPVMWTMLMTLYGRLRWIAEADSILQVPLRVSCRPGNEVERGKILSDPEECCRIQGGGGFVAL